MDSIYALQAEVLKTLANPKRLELIHRQMADLLKKRGVKVIEAVGARLAYVLAGVGFLVGALVLVPVLRSRGETPGSDGLPIA